MKTRLRILVCAALAVLVATPAFEDTAQAGNLPGWQGTPLQKPTTPAVRPRAFGKRKPAEKKMRPARWKNWVALWQDAWAAGANTYAVRVAATVRGVPLCAGNVAGRISSLVVETGRAINTGRDGDAARLLAEFQDKLMCIDVKSMWTLDLVMAAFMANVAELPARERQKAVRAILNAMLLVFDQIQYTGRSYLLPALYHTRSRVKGALDSYSGRELGLWFYDYQSGAMVRRTFGRDDVSFKNGLMDMISRPGRFAGGECTILEMASQGFTCGGVPGLGSKGGGGGGAMPASSGGQLACMSAAASVSGSRGALRCMARAGGRTGGSIGAWMARARPSLHMRGILDDFCTGRTGGDPANPMGLETFPEGDAQHQEAGNKGTWERFKAWVNSKLDYISGGDSGSAPDAGTPDAGPTPEQKAAVDSFTDYNLDDPADRRLKHKVDEWLKKTDPGGGSGMSEDSSACGASTNAVARANMLFDCAGSGGGRPGSGGSTGPLAGQNAPGTRSMPAPGPAGGYAGGGGMSGLMSCAVQGGSLVRTSLNDSRCRQSMCSSGQSCSCEGGGGAPAELKGQVRRGIFSPNRPGLGARDPRPDDTGAGGTPIRGRGGPSTSPLGGSNPASGR